MIRLAATFIRELLDRRSAIITLARQDFRSRYLGSYLGIVWAFLHPAVYIVILWGVFQFGFRARPVSDHPFILWLMAGIVPWFFFSDSVGNAANSIVDNSFLVKKVAFSLGLLPIVKILSSLLIHLFFIAVLLGMMVAYGYPPDLHWLQIGYYLVALFAFILGLSWVTSSVVIFLRDVSQLVAVCLQFLFWVTPIFWSLSLLPPRYQALVKLNPVFYLVEGYRESVITHVWFWAHPLRAAYFWTVTLALLVIGSTVFRRLRPHFADVL